MPAEKKMRNKNLTIPNALSVFRILVVPFFAWFFLQGDIVTAVVLLALSGFSDLFDGMIARKFNQITELGKMLDPFADKLTQGVVALCLAIRFPVICPVLLIFIAKELMMLCFAIVLLKKRKRPCAAMWYGKVATVMFYVSVAVIVVMDGFFKVQGPVFNAVSNILLIVTAAMMLYAAFRYFQIFRVIYRSDDEKYEFDLPDEIRAKKDVNQSKGK
jgi:cardiolipin synthase